MDNDAVPTSEEVQDMLLELKAREARAKENQKFLCEFIDMYREFTCLWKYGCKDYRNRYVKDRAYTALVDKMKEIDPRADKNSVMRKINALRTAFRREYKKVRKSVVIGKAIPGTKRKYAPSLWYYELLKFVVDEQDHTVPPPGVALLEWQEDHIDGFEEFDEDVKEHDDDTLVEYLKDSSIPQPSIKLEPLSPSSSSGRCSPTMPSATSTSGPMVNLEINSVYSEKDSTINDTRPQEAPPMVRLRRPFPTNYDQIPADLDRFGAYVSTKLRRSSRKQSIIAEKVIAEVLMRANLGTLDETTVLTEAKPTLASDQLGTRSEAL